MRAAFVEELSPLLEMCRKGALADVQTWIRQGRPFALPEDAVTKFARRNPLRVALEAGFQALALELVRAGAPLRDGRYVALQHAVEMKRPDLVRLLLANGADVSEVSMRFVLETWEQETVELFLAHGASLTAQVPLAWALINKVRPALGLAKRLGADDPEIMKQTELALRHHAREGNAKWVSLLLWAGASPFSCGPDDIDRVNDREDGDGGMSATELAVICGHHELLKNKQMLPELQSDRPQTIELLERISWSASSEALRLLLHRGYVPALLQDRGTGAIQSLLSWMGLGVLQRSPVDNEPRGLDDDRARERMKMLHILVANGARWLPEDKSRISDARKHLLRLTPPYTLEFVWLMQQYRAARRSDVEQLLGTPAMTRWIAGEREVAAKLLAQVPDVVAAHIAPHSGVIT